jgi:hypothetical protein
VLPPTDTRTHTRCQRHLSPSTQVRLHDLRSLKLKKGQRLADLKGLDVGIVFCTYDLLIR